MKLTHIIKTRVVITLANMLTTRCASNKKIKND